MEIVRADASHVEALAPLFDAYRQFYGQPTDPSAARVFLAERLARGESVVFAALDAGRAAGFVQLYPSFSSVALRRLWILNDLYVAPASRRHGVARALLARAEAFARETGARGLVLETAVDNRAAQALYEASGWRRVEAFCTYERAV